MVEFINIALPKGRLGEKAYSLFEQIGYGCPSILENNRKLIFENEDCGVRYFWAKPSADIGIVGKDILLEYGSDVYELLDLGMGKCCMAVAGPKGMRINSGRTLRVATKFPNIAREYYSKLSREIDIIKLNGSIEIAPLLNLSDVIVDIVETGTTLLENNLEKLEEIVSISARLISNKVSYKFKNRQIEDIVEKVKGLL